MRWMCECDQQERDTREKWKNRGGHFEGKSKFEGNFNTLEVRSMCIETGLTNWKSMPESAWIMRCMLVRSEVQYLGWKVECKKSPEGARRGFQSTTQRIFLISSPLAPCSVVCVLCVKRHSSVQLNQSNREEGKDFLRTAKREKVYRVTQLCDGKAVE